MMRRLLARWGMEAGIFLLLAVRFLFERYGGLAGWSATWYALDYSLGRGSRLLAGSILKLFCPAGVSAAAAYTFVSAALLLCCLLAALFLAKAYRLAPAGCKPACLVLIAFYLAAPYCPSYLWNDVNMGRLDAFLLPLTLCCALVGLGRFGFYTRLSLMTAVSLAALLFHQVYFFIFYPFVLSLLLWDAFAGGKPDWRRLAAWAGGACLVAAVFLLLQFTSRLNAASAEALMAALSDKTDLGLSQNALDFEYFHDFSYNWKNQVLPFYRGENPLGHTLATGLTLLPVIGLFGFLWVRVLSYGKGTGRALLRPYVYLLLINLLYLPAFVLTIDWNRWFAAFFACQTFLFLFLLAREDPAAVSAGVSLSAAVKRRPLGFVLIICYLSRLSTFGARYFTDEANCVYDWMRQLVYGILGGNG